MGFGNAGFEKRVLERATKLAVAKPQARREVTAIEFKTEVENLITSGMTRREAVELLRERYGIGEQRRSNPAREYFRNR